MGNVRVKKQESRTLTMEAERDGETFILLQQWISGEAEGVEVDLTCGAGLGSPTLAMTVRKGGIWRREVVDVRDMLTAWAQAIEKEIDEELLSQSPQAKP